MPGKPLGKNRLQIDGDWGSVAKKVGANGGTTQELGRIRDQDLLTILGSCGSKCVAGDLQITNPIASIRALNVKSHVIGIVGGRSARGLNAVSLNDQANHLREVIGNRRIVGLHHVDDRAPSPKLILQDNKIIKEAEFLHSAATMKGYDCSLGNIGKSIVLDQPGRGNKIGRLDVSTDVTPLHFVPDASLGVKGMGVKEIGSQIDERGIHDRSVGQLDACRLPNDYTGKPIFVSVGRRSENAVVHPDIIERSPGQAGVGIDKNRKTFTSLNGSSEIDDLDALNQNIAALRIDRGDRA